MPTWQVGRGRRAKFEENPSQYAWPAILTIELYRDSDFNVVVVVVVGTVVCV